MGCRAFSPSLRPRDRCVKPLFFLRGKAPNYSISRQSGKLPNKLLCLFGVVALLFGRCPFLNRLVYRQRRNSLADLTTLP